MHWLNRLFDPKRPLNGWLVSSAVYVGASAVIYAAVTLVGVKSWWIPWHVGLAIGVAAMGFLRERNIGSGPFMMAVTMQAAIWVGVVVSARSCPAGCGFEHRAYYALPSRAVSGFRLVVRGEKHEADWAGNARRPY